MLHGSRGILLSGASLSLYSCPWKTAPLVSPVSCILPSHQWAKSRGPAEDRVVSEYWNLPSLVLGNRGAEPILCLLTTGEQQKLQCDLSFQGLPPNLVWGPEPPCHQAPIELSCLLLNCNFSLFATYECEKREVHSCYAVREGSRVGRWPFIKRG